MEGIPDWIRTSNLRLRRPTRYPIVLRGRGAEAVTEISLLIGRSEWERVKTSLFLILDALAILK